MYMEMVCVTMTGYHDGKWVYSEERMYKACCPPSGKDQLGYVDGMSIEIFRYSSALSAIRNLRILVYPMNDGFQRCGCRLVFEFQTMHYNAM